MTLEIHTIGHSNRTTDTLLDMLRGAAIQRLVDIRAFPRSRRHPHFDRAILEASLASQSIDYLWLGDQLGGYRKPRADSPHTALTDAAFRGFADYMDTANFVAAIERLRSAAENSRLAIMCAEADFRHCHRQLIADYLVTQGVRVQHIQGVQESKPHLLNACLDNTAEPPVYNKHDQGDLFASLLH